MPVKILYIQSTSEIGGTDIALLRTIQKLTPGRFEPHLLVPKEGPLTGQYKKAGCRIHYLPAMRKLTTHQGPWYLVRAVFEYFPAVFKIVRIIQREKIEIVHTNTIHNLYGFLAARIWGVPHVWHVREIVVQSQLARTVEVFLVRHFSDRFIVMDNAIAEMFQKNGAHPDNMRKLYDGIDLEKFHAGISGRRIRRELGISEEAPLAGMICRLDPWKGVDIFLEAAALVRAKNCAARFLVCGGEIEGHEGYEEKLKQKASELKISESISFTGWRYYDQDIPEVLAALNVSAQCPLHPEPYGLVNLEAMACAVPVVAAAQGGPLETCVDKETAFLVTPHDPEAVAEAVLSLLENPERAKVMGNAGRKRAEEYFDCRKEVLKLEKLYDELL